jgi:hypothetical protein
MLDAIGCMKLQFQLYCFSLEILRWAENGEEGARKFIYLLSKGKSRRMGCL